MRLLALVAAAALLAAGCGQRGPLYLRDKPPPGVTPARAESYQPVPYPADDERDNEKKK
ncbi:MAG: LPS translocon maturation chaperone LptM [Burkholderiales bacterium]